MTVPAQDPPQPSSTLESGQDPPEPTAAEEAAGEFDDLIGDGLTEEDDPGLGEPPDPRSELEEEGDELPPGSAAPTEQQPPAAQEGQPREGEEPPAPATAQGRPAPGGDFTLTFRGENRSYNREGIMGLAQQGLNLQQQREHLTPVLDGLAEWGIINGDGQIQYLTDREGNVLYNTQTGRPISMFEHAMALLTEKVEELNNGGGQNPAVVAGVIPGLNDEQANALKDDFPEAHTAMQSMAGRLAQLEQAVAESRGASTQYQEDRRQASINEARDRAVGVFNTLANKHREFNWSPDAMKQFMAHVARPGVTFGHITEDFLELEFPGFRQAWLRDHPDATLAHGETPGARRQRARSQDANDEEFAGLFDE